MFTRQKNFLEATGALSILAVVFFLFRIIISDSGAYSFVPGNLALAWVGFLAAWFLKKQLKVRRWLSWQNIAFTLLWLFFLPNCWYVLTDFIHIVSVGQINVLYDIVMLTSLVIAGFMLGFYSLYIVHEELTKRLGAQRAYQLAEVVILLASFAIYLGRVLRWNSWDVLTNPSGLIINVSDRVADPLGHPGAINITGLFFLFLSACYYGFLKLAGPPSKSPH